MKFAVYMKYYMLPVYWGNTGQTHAITYLYHVYRIFLGNLMTKFLGDINIIYHNVNCS